MNISLERTNVTEIYYQTAFIINYKYYKNIGEIVWQINHNLKISGIPPLSEPKDVGWTKKWLPDALWRGNANYLGCIILCSGADHYNYKIRTSLYFHSLWSHWILLTWQNLLDT